MKIKSLIILVALLCFQQPALSAILSGKVLLAKGTISATDLDGKTRLLAKGQKVNQGDRVTTAQKSFVVIKMQDNTKITLRPESSMLIEEFRDDEGDESAKLNLIKGGLRAVTGLIGKKKPEAVKLSTKVATIGIRGTDFIARLCGDDCIQEEKTYIDLDYIDVSSPTLGPEINDELPFGLYFLVKEGRIYVEQCPVGTKSAVNGSTAGCPQIELALNQSGYAGAQALGITPKIPLFLENDPHVDFSDIPESSLDALDVLQDGSSTNLQCDVTDG